MPSAFANMGSVIDLMSSSDKLKILSDALKSAQLLGILESQGPFTVFAPTDPAVAQAPARKFKIVQGNQEQFTILAKYHVVEGYYPTKIIHEALKKRNHLELEALCGEKLIIKASGFLRNHIRINDASIVTADLIADNGIVHTIDTVLFPPRKNIHLNAP